MAKAAKTKKENLTEEETSSHQFVTFQVAEEGFGLSMEQVAEIIRLPQTIGVPLTPPALVGLANLRGNVLPILDLRQILALEKSKNTDATRVLVADIGSQMGLIVDRVNKVISVNESKIEKAEGVKTTTDSQFLCGVIREGDSLVQLLDVARLIKTDFSSIVAAKSKSKYDNNLATVNNEIKIDDNIGQLVSFNVAGQEYAFDLMSVEEIVRVPENITKMPSTDHHVLGMIDLRGRLLPLVSLRQIFGLEKQKIDEHNRILVIAVHAAGGILNSVGIVVDEVLEVLSVAMNKRDPVPSLLNSDNEDDGDISAICRLDEGKRLVSILSAQAMFEDQAIQAVIASNNIENEKMNNQKATEDPSIIEDDDDTQMVVFKLADQEYGVTIEHVEEITRVPDDMNKVPKTADFIEGLVNLRGTVLPVLDMRSRFCLERQKRNDRQRILVLNIEGNRTGFIMDSVVEVLRLNRHSIEDAPDLSDDQTRVMGRVVNLKDDKRMIQVLDVNELLSTKEGKELKKL